MEPALYYIEYASGYCTILRAADEDEARSEGLGFAKAWQTRVTKVRLATEEDQANYRGAIYR